MAIIIREAQADEIEELIPLLLQAEASESALRWGLQNLSDTIYRMDEDGKLVGAASLRWHKEPVDIIELAIAENRHGARVVPDVDTVSSRVRDDVAGPDGMTTDRGTTRAMDFDA